MSDPTEFPYRITVFDELKQTPGSRVKGFAIGESPTGRFEIVKHDFKDGSYKTVALTGDPKAARAAMRLLQWDGRTPEAIWTDLARCWGPEDP